MNKRQSKRESPLLLMPQVTLTKPKPCTNHILFYSLFLYFTLTGQVSPGLQADTKELASRQGPISVGSR